MKSHHFLTTLKGFFFSFILLSFVIGCSKKTEEEETPTAPVAQFSFTPVSPKANQAVTFNNTSTNATSFVWSAAGTNFNSTEKNPTFTFTTAGTFEVKLVATSAGGSSTKTTSVSIAPADNTTPAPVAAFSFSPTTITTADEVTFTNESTNATSYQWSAEGTSFSSTAENPKFTFTTAGDFNVKLVATGAGGTNEITKRVTVSAAQSTPVAAFSFSPANPQIGQAVSFTNQSTNATSYQWSAAGTSFSSTAENPKFTFTTAGDFDVKLVATSSAGTNEITKRVTVSAAQLAPVAAFSFSPTSPEAGQEVSFTNESTNATSYQWSAAGTTFSSTAENPKFTFTTAGDFDVKLVATSSAGTNEITKRVTVVAASGGGGNNNPCNLPECYVERTTSSTAAGNVTVTYGYTVVNGKKLISQITTGTGFGNVVTSIQYDAQGRRIKDETRFGGALQNYIEYQYSNNDRTVRANSYDAAGTLTGYTISQYDTNMRLTRTDSYTPAGALTGYVVYSNFLNIEGSFPQLVQTYNANNVITQTDTHTYQNCQLIKTVSKDGSGTVIGEVNNTIDARGLLRTSVATIAGTTSTTQYVYDCD